jgi:hypothetical protein
VDPDAAQSRLGFRIRFALKLTSVALRTLLRHRAQLIEHRSPHVLHMRDKRYCR